MNIFAEMAGCLSFKNYRLFRSDRGGKNFGYMLIMTIICYLLTVVVGVFGSVIKKGGFDFLKEEIPAFSMSEEGILTIDGKFDETSSSNQRVIVDTDSFFDYDEESGTIYKYGMDGSSQELCNAFDYRQFVVVSADCAIMYQAQDTEGINCLYYEDIPQEYLSVINTDSLVELIKKFAVIFAVVAFIFILIRLAVWNIVNAGLMAILSSSKGMKNTFGQLYSMALRAYTPAYLVCCLVSAFSIPIPFKTILAMIATAFIMTKALKTLKEQEEETAALAVSTQDSDAMFRAMYGENGQDIMSNDNILNDNDNN